MTTECESKEKNVVRKLKQQLKTWGVCYQAFDHCGEGGLYQFRLLSGAFA